MLPAIEILLWLLGVFCLVCLFLRIKNSRFIGKVTHAVVDTPPESDEELIAQLDTSLDEAGQRAAKIVTEAAAAKARAERLNEYKRLG